MGVLRQDPNTTPDEEREARTERLLQCAAEWEPTTEAPDNLAERAMQRLERKLRWERCLSCHPRLVGGWSVGTVAVAAGITLLFIRSGTAPVALTPSEPVAEKTRATYSYNKGVQPAPTALAREPVLNPARVTVFRFSTTGPRAPAPGVPTTAEKIRPALPESVAGKSGIARSSPREQKVRVQPAGRVKEAEATRRFPETTPRTPWSLKNDLLAEVNKTAIPDSTPVWEVEEPVVTTSQEEYSVIVPVMFAETTADDSKMTAVPAVVEMRFSPKEVKTAPISSGNPTPAKP